MSREGKRMILAKAVEQAYRRQLQVLREKCPGCGVYMTRVEAEEFGQCWLCEKLEGTSEDEGD